MASSSAELTHPVVFTTQTAYPLPSQKFMLPTSWKRYQLSQLVNKALSLPRPIPFEFLVRGEILRGTLAEWCAEKGVGEEESLDIEYFESVMPPQRMSTLPHEDWVTSISCQLPGYFLTASYDGAIRVFNYSQQPLRAVHVHSAPVTSVCVLSRPSEQADSHLIASASHDLTARLTRVNLSSTPGSSEQPKAQILASLHLHTAVLSSVSANPSGSHLLTSSWDGLIGLWNTSIPEIDEVPLEETTNVERKKRRKIAEDVETARPKRKEPAAVLKSHTARVSRVVFSRDAKGASAHSCGFDSTVRTWDVENGVCTGTITASSKPFLDLALTQDGQSALAASTDRTVSQYDLRVSTTASTTPSVASLTHPSTPSCIAVPSTSSTKVDANASEYQLVTGAYDGVVRLWDLRSTRSAVAAFRAGEGRAEVGDKKVLSVDWVGGLVGVAGEGGVEVWKVGESERTTAGS